MRQRVTVRVSVALLLVLGQCLLPASGTACESQPCLNAGICSDGGSDETFSCECITGVTGRQCELNLNECMSSPCQNGAQCVDVFQGFRCVCPAEFSGADCRFPADPCLSSPCDPRGTRACQAARDGSAYCSCTAGHTGEVCETVLDPCLSAPCQNNATCNASLTSPDDFVCTCVPPYSGPTCTSRATTNGNTANQSSSAALSLGAGVGAGVVVALIVIGIILLLLVRKKRERRRRASKSVEAFATIVDPHHPQLLQRKSSLFSRSTSPRASSRPISVHQHERIVPLGVPSRAQSPFAQPVFTIVDDSDSHNSYDRNSTPQTRHTRRTTGRSSATSTASSLAALPRAWAAPPPVDGHFPPLPQDSSEYSFARQSVASASFHSRQSLPVFDLPNYVRGPDDDSPPSLRRLRNAPDHEIVNAGLIV